MSVKTYHSGVTNNEPKDEIPQNNYSEAEASIVRDSFLVNRSKMFDAKKQHDSEGMMIEK